jgi:formylglycine-generating enzyme required for sulfatase activity
MPLLLGTLLFLTFFTTCANNTSPSSGPADIELHLIWKSSGKEVASTGVSLLYITISSTSPQMKDSISTIINWEKKTGSIKNIPIGIPIRVSIDARNQSDETLFRGVDSIASTSSNTPLSIVLSKLPPPAPSIVELSAPAGGAVRLTWRYNSKIEDNFFIERGIVPNAFTVIGTVGKDVTMFVDTAVPGSGTYYYRVSAANDAGYSASAAGQVSVAIALPPLPAPPVTTTQQNRPPKLNTIGAKAAKPGELLSFTITALDPDTNKVTYLMSGNLLLLEASLDPLSGEFIWVPGNTVTGTITGSFYASDGYTLDSQKVDFIVSAQCIVSAIPILSADTTIATMGDSITLSVLSGTLGTSASWDWFINGCGATPLQKGQTIRVAPKATSIYYCRGSGPCGDGGCDSVVVTVKRQSAGSDSVIVTKNKGSDTIKPPVTVDTQATAPECMVTVTYDGNGGDATTTPQPTKCKCNTEMTLPMQKPDRTGYTFTFWNTSATGNGVDYGSGGKFAVGNTNVTLYAKWGSPTDGMVRIAAKGKTFMMGDMVLAVEDTVHLVKFSADYWMDTTEVNQESYNSLMKATYSGYLRPSWNSTYGVGDNYPAYYVSWYDAVLYCNARTKATGSKDTVYRYMGIPATSGNACIGLAELSIDLSKRGFRLPTEAQWEFACRGGTTTSFYWGKDYDPYPSSVADLNEVDKYAVWNRNSFSKGSGSTDFGTHLVASKLENGFGLYDMSGNVFEWCNDWFGSYSSGSQTDPIGSASGSGRVLRGGSWNRHAAFLRSADRSYGAPSNTCDFIGFRVCLPAQ